MSDSQPTRRRSRLWVAVLMVVTLAAFPIGTLASHQYADVPDSNPFHGDITAITNAGVTSGCGDGNYCPDRNVTRAEMAAFMNRLGALAANKTPVVNATTVDRYEANGLNRVAYNSTASLVDGNAASSGSLTTTITAPGRGYLLVWGHAEIYNASGSTADTVITCQLELDNVLIGGTATFADADYLVADDDEECSPMGGVSVCGGTYTVELAVSGVATDTNVTDSTIMVEYVPFNGTGGIPPLIGCLIIILPGQGADSPHYDKAQ